MSIQKKFVISIVALEALLFSVAAGVPLVNVYFQLMSEPNYWNKSVVANSTFVAKDMVIDVLSQSLIYGLCAITAAAAITIILSFMLGSALGKRIKKIALLAKNIKEGQQIDLQVDQGADAIGELSRYIYELGEQIHLNVRDLTAAEERFRIAIKAARAGAWKWNMKSGEMYWSVGSYYALGYLPDRDKATFELWRSAIHPDDLPSVDNAISEMLTHHSAIDVEYRIIRPNGEERWMRSVGRIYFDVQENPDEIYGLQIDITRQRRLQENLREQQYLLRAVLDNCSDSVVTLDCSQNILMVNSSLLRMFQYSETDLLGASIEKLVTSTGAAMVEQYIEQCLDSGATHFERQTKQTTARRKDGSTFKAGISISGLSTNFNNKTLRFVVSIANLANERRQMILTDMQAVVS